MIRHFRKYEKWIFWSIVILILPTFSVTGIMFSTCGRSENPPAGKLYGRDVSHETFVNVQDRLGKVAQVVGQNLPDEAVWNHLIFLKKADEAGVQVSDDELAERIRKLFKEMDQQRLAFERLERDFPNLQPRQRQMIFQQLFEQEAANAKFDRDLYDKRLDAAKVTPDEFERTIREQMRIDKLREIVINSGKPDPEKVYERYQDEYHKRKAAYVAFKAEDYPPDEGKTGADELKKYYERHTDRFREPRKVDIEWVAVPAAGFEREVAAPTDREVAERYETFKERYRLDTPTPPTGTAGLGTTPTAQEARYRPLAEVKAELAAELRNERMLDLARRKAEAIREKVAVTLTAGQAVSLTAVAAENGAQYGRSDPVEPIDLIDEKDIRNVNLLNLVDKLGAAGPASLSEVLTHADRVSAFIIRLLAKTEARTPPFDEIQAKVRESYFRGLDEELRKHHLDNASKYKTPASAAIEYVSVPYARFERAVPKEVTGTARQEELKKKADALLAEVREAAATKTMEGKLRDIETVAVDKGVDHARATVEKTGKEKDLPAEVRSFEVASRLERGDDKVGALSPTFENEPKTGVFAYVVKSTKPEVQLTLDQARERVRKDVLAERAFERARDTADAFAKEVAATPAELRALAEKRGLKVAETSFVGRRDKTEGLPETTGLVGNLFSLNEVGATGSPAIDHEGKLAVAFRYIAREPADPAKFKEHEKELREIVKHAARSDLAEEWFQSVRLEARQVDEAVLKEVYGLRYGEDGLAEMEAAHIYLAMDKATVKERLAEKARKDAEDTLAEIRNGGRFDALARKYSQDQTNRRRGGDLGFFKRETMVKDFADAAFALKPGEVCPEPVKTQFGWHLIQVTEKRGDEIRARHILFRSERGTDDEGELLPLDAETRKVAMEKALEKAKKADERVKAGEDFGAVAKELTDEYGSGEKRTYELDTPFERAAFAAKPNEVGEVISLADGHHLLHVEELGAEGRGRGAMKPRVVRHILAQGDRGRAQLTQIRNELTEKRASFERDAQTGQGAGARGVRFEFRKAFEGYAESESSAPSGSRGGRVGVFREDPDLSKWGSAFREKMYSLKDGEVSGIVEGKDGYHIVKVIGRTKKTYDESRKDVAASLLESLEF